MPFSAPAREPLVLIVDDQAANIQLLGHMLSDAGYDVMPANSGEQALRALLRQRFAVILLDVQMPTMDGYEVARHVRMNQATRDVPIIFLTATLDSEANVMRGYDSGAVDFLFKPIDSTVLLSKVRIFLELEGYDKIVRISDQVSATSQPRFHLACKPLVQHLVQVDVRQQRRYHPALRCSGIRAVDSPFLHHARVQPLADEA